MKTAIIYASKHGTTGRVAMRLRDGLKNGNADIFNLKDKNNLALEKYDQIVIGGSIHAGKIQQRIKKFCNANRVELLQKRLFLFLCGMNEPAFQNELEEAFPAILRDHAVSCSVVGGEFLFERMNWVERYLVRKISGVNASVSRLNDQEIESLLNVLNHEA